MTIRFSIPALAVVAAAGTLRPSACSTTGTQPAATKAGNPDRERGTSTVSAWTPPTATSHGPSCTGRATRAQGTGMSGTSFKTTYRSGSCRARPADRYGAEARIAA